MTERILELLLDESKWLFAAMLLSIVGVVALWGRRRHEGLSRRSGILWAMNLFYGCMLGILSAGHLLAVTVEIPRGTLEGSLWILYPIGLALAIPSWWLAFLASRSGRDLESARSRTVALNAWLGVSLLAFGLHNWPLATPAALNVGYRFHTRRAVGWAIVTTAIVANLLLFTGSLVFLASGQSFEQFKGME